MYGGVQDANSVCSMRWLHLTLRTTPLLVFFTNKRTHVKTYIIAGISLARKYLKIQYDKYHVVTVAMTDLQVRRFVGEEHQQRRCRSTFLTRIMWVSMVPYSKENVWWSSRCKFSFLNAWLRFSAPHNALVGVLHQQAHSR